MYRNTYVEVNLSNLRYNIKKIIDFHKKYKYYFGVVKADSYGHYGIKPVKAIIESGVNYLAVSSLEEALEIRKEIRDIPILCLGIIDIKYIYECINNDITITVSNLDYVKELISCKIKDLKIHFKINTGMNRLGFSSVEELDKAYKLLNGKVIIEGIFTHIYNDSNKKDTNVQIEKFNEITKIIDLKEIPIIHFGGSNYFLNYPKLDFVNGCRLGIIMYGLTENTLNLKSTFSLYSKVIQLNEVESGIVGYNGNYKVKEKQKIAVIPVGYADGIIRKNTGRYLYINNKKFNIVGNICMDMLFVKVDDKVKVGDKVVLIKDIEHIKYISNYLETIPYEIICGIGKRVPRVYIN